MKMKPYFLALLSMVATLCMAQNLQPESDKRQQLEKWLAISFEYRYNELDSALYYGFKVLEEAKSANYRDLEADALRSLSTTYQAKGDFALSLEYGAEALKIARVLEDQLRTAHTLNVIGITHDQQGNFVEALNYYREAYDGYKKLGDEEWLAMMAVNLGVLFKGQGEYARVIPYYREAYAIYSKLGLPVEAVFCETNLGSVYYFTQQYDSCVYYSLKAAKDLEEHGYLQIQPTAQCNAGLGYYGLGRFQEARSYLELALTGHRQYANKKEIAFALIHLAKVYEELGMADQSHASLLEARQTADEIGSAKESMDAAKLLAISFARRRDYQQAYETYIGYSAIKDTLYEQEKVRLLTNYQVQYETERKEQRIAILNQETAIQRLQLRQRGLWLLTALGVLLGGGVITYFVLKQRKLEAEARLQQELARQQQQATLTVLDAEERERSRIARDLHDGVGQILSTALLNLNYLNKGLQEGKAIYTEQMGDAIQLVRDSYDEMRSISHQMMPSSLLKSGLPSAIREFVSKIDNRAIQVQLSVSDLEERLDSQTETVLYRVVQEAINNVIKHARASQLSIQMMKDGNEVIVAIEDNGVGFEKGSAMQREGIGLRNMRSRLAVLKGFLEIDTTPGKGTLITISAPI